MGDVNDRKVFATAKLMNLTTLYIFQVAYRECRGNIYGLRPPEEVHERWKNGYASLPLYVIQWVSTRCITVH